VFFFLQQQHSFTLIGVVRKASLVAGISQLLSHSQSHCIIVVLGSVWLVSRGWSEASRAEGWEGGGGGIGNRVFTCTHCHVDIRMGLILTTTATNTSTQSHYAAAHPGLAGGPSGRAL